MVEFVTIDQAYDAVRVYLELEKSEENAPEFHELALAMMRGDDGQSSRPDLYPAFRNTVKSDPMSAADAMRCASEFLGARAGSSVALARVSDDLRDGAVDETHASPAWTRWQQAVDAL